MIPYESRPQQSNKPMSFFVKKWLLVLFLLIDILYTLVFGMFLLLELSMSTSHKEQMLFEFIPTGISNPKGYMKIFIIFQAIATICLTVIDIIGLCGVLSETFILTGAFCVIKLFQTVISVAIAIYNTPLWGHAILSLAIIVVLLLFLHELYRIHKINYWNELAINTDTDSDEEFKTNVNGQKLQSPTTPILTEKLTNEHLKT